MTGRAKRAAACASACGRRGGGRRGGDRYLLALEVEAREVAVDEVIPGGARALGVGAGVPRGRANDETVEPGDVVAAEVANVHSLQTSLVRDVARNGLGVACEAGARGVSGAIRTRTGIAPLIPPSGARQQPAQTPPDSETCTCAEMRGVRMHQAVLTGGGRVDEADAHLRRGGARDGVGRPHRADGQRSGAGELQKEEVHEHDGRAPR